VAVTETEGGWWIDVAWQDRPGLLAAIAHSLTDAGLPIDDAVLATWPDGAVLDAFKVPVGEAPDADEIRGRIDGAAQGPLTSSALADAEVEVDHGASPWHTVVEVRLTDRPGVLAALSTAFAAAGITVRSATASARDGLVIDRFEVTDRDGAKLDDDLVERLRQVIQTGVTVKRRRFGRRLAVRSGSVL
jgi:UTP:GlnB (protein PII) uridylyltransferase